MFQEPASGRRVTGNRGKWLIQFVRERRRQFTHGSKAGNADEIASSFVGAFPVAQIANDHDKAWFAGHLGTVGGEQDWNDFTGLAAEGHFKVMDGTLLDATN